MDRMFFRKQDLSKAIILASDAIILALEAIILASAAIRLTSAALSKARSSSSTVVNDLTPLGTRTGPREINKRSIFFYLYKGYL
jgi:hypothetical protein